MRARPGRFHAEIHVIWRSLLAGDRSELNRLQAGASLTADESQRDRELELAGKIHPGTGPRPESPKTRSPATAGPEEDRVLGSVNAGSNAVRSVIQAFPGKGDGCGLGRGAAGGNEQAAAPAGATTSGKRGDCAGGAAAVLAGGRLS